MRKGVVIVRKRSIAIAALLLLAAAVVHRALGYGGVLSLALFSSAVTMTVVLIVWWAREKLQSPYALAKDTRLLVDHLADQGIGSWRAYRNALLTHRYTYIRYLRRLGVERVDMFPYVKHIDVCIRNKIAITMPLPPRTRGEIVKPTYEHLDGYEHEGVKNTPQKFDPK